ncbi:MAG: glycosyltransferase family 4 protein [Chitinophagales bacterium]|nr:glycosyltransferase family 4 protein [Chitinophagales bacterium]
MVDNINSEVKSILFLSPQLPYPPISGGVIKSWRLVEYLSQKYKLSVATFLKNEDEKEVDTFLSKVQLKSYYFEYIDIQRTALNLIKSNLLLQPLNLYRNRSKKFKKRIEELARNVDAIFVDHYEVFQYVPKSFKGKIVLHQHNCEYLIWERYAQIESSYLKQLALKNQSFWIKRYERNICKKSHSILAAPNDIDELVKIGADKKKFYETYHLGEEDLLYRDSLKWEEAENAIVFVGTLTWEANVDAVVYFLDEIWPFLYSQRDDIKFYIVGKNPDDRIVRRVNKLEGVVLTGFVSDLDDYYKKAKVFISPLRFGSGIKVKVMNALYRGIPTVSTTIGAEGLAVVNNENMLLTDNPIEFAEAVMQLIDDKNLWQEISKNSRMLANELYTWSAVFKKVEQSIQE